MTLSKELLRSAIEFSKSPSGQVWAEGLVEVVAQALQDLSLYIPDPTTGNIRGFVPENVARAVLAALVTEVSGDEAK